MQNYSGSGSVQLGIASLSQSIILHNHSKDDSIARYRQKKRWEDNIRALMDRPGVHQVSESSGEQRKMEETGCEVICDAQMIPVVKG